MQHELQTFKTKRSKLDDEGLSLIEALESANNALAAAKSELDKIEAEWREDQAELQAAKEVAESESARLLADRDTRAKDMDAAAIGMYEKLRVLKQGKAVARIERSACSGCRINLPTHLVQQVRGGMALVQCPNCERILVAGWDESRRLLPRGSERPRPSGEHRQAEPALPRLLRVGGPRGRDDVRRRRRQRDGAGLRAADRVPATAREGLHQRRRALAADARRRCGRRRGALPAGRTPRRPAALHGRRRDVERRRAGRDHEGLHGREREERRAAREGARLAAAQGGARRGAGPAALRLPGRPRRTAWSSSTTRRSSCATSSVSTCTRAWASA